MKSDVFDVQKQIPNEKSNNDHRSNYSLRLMNCLATSPSNPSKEKCVTNLFIIGNETPLTSLIWAPAPYE